MNTARAIRGVRVAVSALFLTAVTLACIGPPAILLATSQHAVEVQLLPAISAGSLAIFVAWVIVTLIFGRIYCSTVCPLGTLQDIIARLRRYRVYRYAQPHNKVAVAFLIATLLAWALNIAAITRLLDPMEEYRRVLTVAALSPMWITLTAVILAATVAMAWKAGRLYCNTVCPLGSALALVSRKSILHIEIDPDKCVRCRRCVDRCKAQCIDMDTLTVDNGRCVVCLNCLTAECPNDAISYTANRHRLSTPMFRPVAPAQGDIAVNNVQPDK